MVGRRLEESFLAGMVFEQVVLEQVVASGLSWRDLVLIDTRIDRCDFANADWLGARLQRCQLRGTRMTGLALAESRCNHCTWRDCRLDLAVLQHTTFENCAFEDCDLRGADFEGADLRGVTFARCDLREARMFGARLAGADLRGSRLDGLQAGAGELGGVIVDVSQALDVARLTGVEFR